MKQMSLKYKFLIFITAVFLVVFTSFFVLYYKNKTDTLSRQIHSQNVDLIEKIISSKQAALSRLNNSTYITFVQDVQINSLIKEFKNSASEKFQIKKNMDTFAVNHTSVASVAIYFPAFDTVLTTQAGQSYRFSDYFDFQLYQDTMRTPSLMTGIRTMRLQNHQNVSVITVITTVRKGNTKDLIATHISVPSLYTEVIKYLNTGNSSNIIVLDENGTLVFSNQPLTQQQADEYPKENKNYADRALTHFYSEKENLQYIIELNYPAKDTSFLKDFILLFLIILLAAAGITYYVYRLFFRPLNHVITQAKEREPSSPHHKNEILQLEEIFRGLQQENSKIHLENTEFRDLYRERVLLNMLLTASYSHEEIVQQLVKYDISISTTDYTVLVLSFREHSSSTLLEVEALIQRYFNKFQVIILEKQAHLCVALHSSEFQNNSVEAEIYEIATTLITEIYSRYQDGFLAIGPYVGTLGEIGSSYNVAAESLEYTKSLNARLVFYQDLSSQIADIFYAYTPQQELELLKAIKLLDSALAEQVIDSLFQSLTKTSLPTNTELNSLLHMLVLTIHKQTEQNLDFSAITAEYLTLILDSDFLRDSIVFLKQYLAKLIAAFSQQTEGNTIYQIIDYISTHFTENMQLLDLEEIFNLNRYYIGQQIKETIGISFNDYLNQLRIEEACKLLVSTNLPMKKISEELGYQYPYYFSKIFKQEKNMTPNEYRKQKKEIPTTKEPKE